MGDMPSDGEDLALELQKIYDSEINISIGWFWDGGITLRLGDEMNGFSARRRPSDQWPIFSHMAAGSHRTLLPDFRLRRFPRPELRERSL